MRDTQKLLTLVADGITEWPFRNWNFGDSIGFESLLSASGATCNPTWENFVTAWVRSWGSRSEPFVRLDCTAPGRAMVKVATKTGDPVLTESLSKLAEYLRGRPQLEGLYETWESSPLLPSYGPEPMEDWEEQLLAQPPAGVFLDCLHFDPPFFSSLGRLLNDSDLVSCAVEQAVGYCTLLQKESGLFDHFALRDVDGTFGPGWGRGQGWALLGLLDTIEEAREFCDNNVTLARDLEKLVDSARSLIQVQISLQREDGHWYAVVDNPGSGNESSTAAFMAHGFQRAADLGILTEEEVRGPRELAQTAVLESLDDDGNVSEVSAAVFACTSPSHYSHVPRGKIVPWGQGPALMVLADLAKGSALG